MRSGQHTIIKSCFWVDDDIQALNPHQKLSAVWLITNDDISPAGVTHVRKAKFSFDTGMPFGALDECLKALPRAFKRFGDMVWSVNFIRHQWNEQTLTTNNSARAVCRSIMELRNPEIRSAILAEYPDLRDVLSDMFNERAPKPSQGVGNPQSGVVQSGTRKKGKGVGKGIPSDEEVENWAAKWPGQPASGLDGPIPPEVVASFLDRFNGSSYGWPPDWQRALVSHYRKASAPPEKNGAKNSGTVSASVSSIDRRKQLEAARASLAEKEQQQEEDRDVLNKPLADRKKLRAEISALKSTIQALEAA